MKQRIRCGAPVPIAGRDKRRQHTTCRSFVKEEGERCYQHRAPLPAYDEAMRKVFE